MSTPGVGHAVMSGWVGRAACADRLDLPWISDTVVTSGHDRAAMRSVCGGCPVGRDCEDHARRADVTGGWWAGRDRDPAALPAALPVPRVRPVLLVLPGLEHLGPLGGAA